MSTLKMHVLGGTMLELNSSRGEVHDPIAGIMFHR
jgi:hypothetical protein